MALYVSDLLTATAAPVSAAPASTRTWQWLRGSSAISGATSDTYTAVTADIGSPLAASQLETNFLATTTATSAATETVQAFDPIRLFSASEPGVWYDPNDISTLFKGPTVQGPVTTPGDTVWTMLDKSQGGPGPQLVANGDFSAGTTGWTTAAANSISVVGGQMKAEVISGADGAYFGQEVSVVAGKSYEVRLTTISDGTSKVARMFVGGFWSGTPITPNAFGSHKVIYTATTTGNVVFWPYAATFGLGTYILCDNISVKEIPGNHATQATTASQPTYGIVPAGGRRNLVIVSEPTKAQLTGSSAGVTDAAAFGTFARSIQFPAGAVSENTYLAGETSWVSGVTATLSVYVRMDDGLAPVFGSVVTANVANDFAINIRGALPAPNANIITDLGGGIYRVSATGTTGASASNSGVIRFATNSGRSFRVTGYTLELGSTATPYQRVTTQYDVTEAGVASLGYLFFDGSGDFMSTGTITPGTDKAQVFTGVRKLSDAAARVLVEYSPTVNTSPGSFGIFAPSAATYTGSLNGSAQSITNIAGFFAPITNVISALYDIAGATIAEESIYRINGVVPAQTNNGVAAGTGNFGNYSLNIGYRPLMGLYLLGQLFPMIVRFGPNLTAARISATESWVASKTAGVTL